MRLAIGSVPLADFNDTAQPASVFEHVLSAYGCEVSVPPAFHEYREMIDACCEALGPILYKLAKRRFRCWLFMASPDRSPAEWAKYPSYSLSRQARDLGFIEAPAMELDIPRRGKICRAGVYAVSLANFADACSFLVYSTRSLVIQSARSDLLSVEGLTAAFEAADVFRSNGEVDDTEGPYHINMNYLALSAYLCPLGDVVVKTDGAFDDKYRSVNMVYDPHGQVADVFAAPA